MNAVAPIIAESPRTGVRALIEDNPIVGVPKVGTKRFWTTKEIATLKALYPEGGLAACVQALPGRTASSIHQKARMIGSLKRNATGAVTERRRYASTPQIDAAITALFTGAPKLGAIKRLALALNRPRTWISNRARALGLTVPRFKEPDWTDEEISIVRAMPGSHPDTIRRRLKAAGYRRTSTAIMLKLKGFRVDSERDPDGSYSIEAIALSFGVNRGVVRGWIDKGWLIGRRHVARSKGLHLPQDKRAVGEFTDHDIRRFVVDNVAAVDFHKVDKFWLVSVLTAPGPREGGRKGGA